MRLKARRQFLIYQKEREKLLRQAHEEVADKFVLAVNRSSKQGKLPQAAHDKFIGKAQPYGGIIWELIGELRKNTLKIIKGSLKKTVGFRLAAGEERLAKTLVGGRKAELSGRVKKAIIDKIYQKLSEALEVELTEQIGELPLTLSETVWDGALVNLRQMRRIIANAIATGEESWSIAKKLREFLVMPEELWGKELLAIKPGQGVYKSAYKNAMRLLASTTNEAYERAGLEAAKQKPWVVGMKWNRSVASPAVCAICYSLATADDYGLGAGVYPLDSFPSMPHPWCYCYGTEVVDIEVKEYAIS